MEDVTFTLVAVAVAYVESLVKVLFFQYQNVSLASSDVLASWNYMVAHVYKAILYWTLEFL